MPCCDLKPFSRVLSSRGVNNLLREILHCLRGANNKPVSIKYGLRSGYKIWTVVKNEDYGPWSRYKTRTKDLIDQVELFA